MRVYVHEHDTEYGLNVTCIFCPTQQRFSTSHVANLMTAGIVFSNNYRF
jgi:hypothetical protein